jgi:hypothetical protein
VTWWVDDLKERARLIYSTLHTREPCDRGITVVKPSELSKKNDREMCSLEPKLQSGVNLELGAVQPRVYRISLNSIGRLEVVFKLATREGLFNYKFRRRLCSLPFGIHICTIRPQLRKTPQNRQAPKHLPERLRAGKATCRVPLKTVPNAVQPSSDRLACHCHVTAQVRRRQTLEVHKM